MNLALEKGEKVATGDNGEFVVRKVIYNYLKEFNN